MRSDGRNTRPVAGGPARAGDAHPGRPAGAPGRAFPADFLTELFRNPLEPGYAEAAARRAAEGPEPPSRRIVTRTVALLTTAALGFLLAVAYQHVVADKPERAKARAGLIAEVKQRQTRTDALQAQADKLREEVAALRDSALTGTDAARLRALEAATGLGKARGGGAVVRVDDGPPPDSVTGPGDGPHPERVHYGDLRQIVNALWSEGAEAISINGQRLTATSTIRNAGGAILVDFHPVSGPYVVTALGPDDLADRFSSSPTGQLFTSLVRVYGMSYEVKAVRDATLPAAAEPQLRYASPLVSSSPQPRGSGTSSPTSKGRR